jgi:hypothetical protein
MGFEISLLFVEFVSGIRVLSKISRQILKFERLGGRIFEMNSLVFFFLLLKFVDYLTFSRLIFTVVFFMSFFSYDSFNNFDCYKLRIDYEISSRKTIC